ncbi:LysR family transcriptional regulator [Larsenimonas suaedae]|uniref:LysR family transcriptional regulator n=1 Tax=Larsenimonas suaedae TaxID=1851019 RepID=A0ABU1GW41_9GAMM|nr:LysR family transcriptional regulator [Larsenimonas suaedae]MCM2973372.1 LysR family transcriptional regulator [Larsenimonas suaedae]MDR5896265.1 LysR family transcriptional regulator [Larsenimonas suaedae]
MDTVTALKVFSEVAHQGAFTAAAERLSMSRSSVSKHIAFLEQRFGARLLNRTTRRLSLTEAGREVLARTEIILREFSGLEGALHEDQASLSGRLRISAPHAFGTRYLGPILAEYRTRYPAVSLELVLGDRQVDLVEEGFDMALRIGTLNDSTLVARRIGDVRVLLCASPAYLARHGTPEHPWALSRHQGLHYRYARHGQRWHFMRDGNHYNGTPQPGVTANSGEVLRDMAIAGLGLTLQPDFLMNEALADGRLVQVMPEYEHAVLGLYCVYTHRDQMTPRLRSLIEHLRQWFDTHGVA